MNQTSLFGAYDNKPDLARWNRGGLTRFDYVDANAATLLEETRLALLGLYLRGGPWPDRAPDAWRELALRADQDRPDPAKIESLLDRVDWSRLLPDLHGAPIDRAQFNARLLQQYHDAPDNPAWEVMRAFARACHILTTHLDAFANEGYLRTATQWENLRRLAEMVNYRPSPPASATSLVALLLDAEKGPAEIEAGLAMKFTPPAGGSPVTFETLDTIKAHPGLNAVHLAGWNRNRTRLGPDKNLWIGAAAGSAVAAGALGLLVRRRAQLEQLRPVTVRESVPQADDDRVELALSPARLWRRDEAALNLEPEKCLIGLPRTDGEALTLQLDTAANYAPGAIVRILRSDGRRFRAVVTEALNGYLRLLTSHRPVGEVQVEALVPFSAKNGLYETPAEITALYFRRVAGTGLPIMPGILDANITVNNTTIARRFRRQAEAGGDGYAHVSGSKSESATVVGAPPEIIPGLGVKPLRTVAFAGKPPQSVVEGAYFVARETTSGAMTGLRVEGIRTAEKRYHLLFSIRIDTPPHRTEFHGPMGMELRPEDHDRSQLPAVADSRLTLDGLSRPAAELLKPGRAFILQYETAAERLAATGKIKERKFLPGGAVEIDFTCDTGLTGWKAGDTTLRFNAVTISHGETRGARTLGSGDGEREAQEFSFKIQDVSFVPSTAAAAGVVPDLGITVDGVKWQYADETDAQADNSRAWSYALEEDGSLRLQFRRRLATGKGNVTVSRYRVGVGAAGNALTAFAIDKPMKKHRFVTGIIQPFAASGGADREAVASMRTNAPAQIVANGRAVSLADFERLCVRHAQVAQAKAWHDVRAGMADIVRIIVIPQGGGMVGAALVGDLIDYLKPRALPGIGIAIDPHTGIGLDLGVTLKADLDGYAVSDIRAAAMAALGEAFSLARRKLGQPLYVAEVMACLTGLDGIDAALITRFETLSTPPGLRAGRVSGKVTAFFPEADQILLLDTAAGLDVKVEAQE